jgi:hypothetical protein
MDPCSRARIILVSISPVFEISKARIASLFVTLTVMVVGVQAGTGVASAQQEGAREVGEPEVMARALTALRSGEYLAGRGGEPGVLGL